MKQSLIEALERYQALVRRYHSSLDLVSPTALETFDLKIADALAFAAAIAELGTHRDSVVHVLDVGSGAGLPGIVIAAARPEAAVVLVERRKKRATFLRICVSQLRLRNVEIYRADVRDLTIDTVQIITAQAFASFTALYCQTRHLHADPVVLLSRKGADWRDEVDELRQQVNIRVDASEVARLHSHGRLIQVKLPGGQACPS